MELTDFILQVEGFDALPPREKIKLFGWHLHTHRGKAIFDNEAIRSCFRQLHLTPPDPSVYLPRMAASKPADLLKEGRGYKLARAARSDLDAKYGVHHTVIHVSQLLSNLPAKVPDLAERTFLIEAMKCYRVEAYRACIVMTWNLTFDHLVRWILREPQRLSDFNLAIPKRFPKKQGLTVSAQEHFEDLKEADVIEVCQTASLVSKNIIEILREKLKRRNIAAHPSQVMVTQSQADDVVTDLVNNVVLALL
ncbi:hypothetical protein [Microvirga pudoricolor]|uniref:hypothetical protein n=1 Tax=Microvirga pudoricolor TaxID=2778729 RepID=UPI00195014F0|nr:hypothetical protein [Microvirga pudoricolor]MBM6593086.1 hypothetical protein [Microvirga pudoricolor]